MNIAYIILAHKNPEQVNRLTKALRYPGVSMHIHIDQKTDIKTFYDKCTHDADKDLFFIHNRVDIKWGRFSIVQSILNALDEVIRNTFIDTPDYIFLLSGQDYPIVSCKTFSDFLTAKAGKEFISAAKFPTPFWAPDGGYNRVNKFYFGDIIKWRYIQKPLQLLMPERDFPKGFHPYGGPMWWGITKKCAEYVIEFIMNNPDFLTFFKGTAVMDEIFFHTIIMNSEFGENAFEILEGSEMLDSMRYLRWCKKQPWHPEILKTIDFETIIGSTRYFARKFDTTVDSKILDLIDEHRKG